MSDTTTLDRTSPLPARPAATRRRARGPGGMSPRVGWLFILPNLLGFALFTLIPLLSGLAIAFTDWDVVSGLEGLSFVGLANFTELAGDPAFWSAVRRTLTYAGFGVPLTMAGGMALALALNGEVPGRAALRVIFFIPHIVSSIAIGFVWLLLLNPSSGLINLGLTTIGISDPPTWLVSQDWSLPSLILIAIWSGVGFHAVIYLSALQSMPTDLHEAAAIDGAGPLRRFFTVTWRSLMPTTTFLLITSMISQSQGFGLIAFLTQGGPGDSSTTMSYLMYQNGFQFYRFGYAAAIGVTSFIGVLILSVLFWRLQRNQGLYS
ncbi:carbohydrate ABC transporter permease [Microlunatus sp. GCM10028923]|uniref:carbohydrate ABC transporter permease n=1 Tax=Microlunatus sp. GCM10028923 TaxID=3273400 RepID=UPI003606BC4B